MKRKDLFIYVCLIGIALSSCRSTTTITTTVPGADVYLGKKKVGETPYVHSDYLPTAISRKIEVRKEGYQTQTTKIRKLETINKSAAIGTFFALVPIIWIGGYERLYQYDLVENGSSAPLKSDYLKVGTPFNTKRNGSLAYIGTEGGKHHIYKTGTIYTVNEDLSLQTEVEVNNLSNSIAIDGYMVGDTKRVVEMDPFENSITISSIGASNEVKTTTIKDVMYLDHLQLDDFIYGYRRSPVNNNFICYDGKKLNLYNENLDLKNSYQTKYSIIEAHLLSDDVIISLEMNDNELYIGVRDHGKEEYHAVELDKSQDNNFFRLNVNEEDVKLYVSSIMGEHKKSDFYPNSTQILTYNLVDLKLEDTKVERLSEKVTSSKRSKYLVNKGVVSDKNSAFLNLEEQWIVTTTSSTGTGSRTYYTGRLVIVNGTIGKHNEKIIDKFAKSMINQDKLSFQVELKNDKLFYLFNSHLKERPAINQVVLNKELEPLTWNIQDIYADQGTLLLGSIGFDMEDGRRMYVHQYKSKLGFAISDVN